MASPMQQSRSRHFTITTLPASVDNLHTHVVRPAPPSRYTNIQPTYRDVLRLTCNGTSYAPCDESVQTTTTWSSRRTRRDGLIRYHTPHPSAGGHVIENESYHDVHVVMV